MGFRARDILLCHSSWASESRRQMARGVSECDRFLFLFFFQGQPISSVWLMIAVLSLCSLCGMVAEWFRRETNVRPAGS